MHSWLQRYKVFLSCGFFLAVSVFLATLNVSSPYRVDPVGVLFLEAMLPLQIGVTAASRGVERAWDTYFDLWSVHQDNDLLRQRVEELEQLAQRAVEVNLANQRLQRLVDLQTQSALPTVAARVIGRGPALWVNRIVLDKGTQQDMAKDMVVLVPEGIVGRVVSTSAHTARVLLASDPGSGIDALVQRTRDRGIVLGTGNGRGTLKYIPDGADVRVGDSVVASGLDEIFPKGHPIGSVVRIGMKDRGMFEDVEVRLHVEFAKLEEVLVVTGRPQYAGQ
jgi:rod shape-determining protein MreC